MHPWHHIELGPQCPDIFPAYIEIPADSNIKYELDKKLGILKVDRIIYGCSVYPANYGFIPRTLAEDDDPLDVVVLCQESIAPGTLIYCRPIGALQMVDDGKLDTKIIAVPEKDPAFSSYKNVEELPVYMKEELRQFFEEYKKLEEKEVKVDEYQSEAYAKAAILKTINRYQRVFGTVVT